jgi:hypothetical protein
MARQRVRRRAGSNAATRAEAAVYAAQCRPLAVYTEMFVRHFAAMPEPPAMAYVEFAHYFVGAGSQHFHKHVRVCAHYGVPVWSLLEALKEGGEAFGFGKDWRG